MSIAVKRTFAILEFVAQKNRAVSFSEIHNGTGRFNRTSFSTLLNGLCEQGYLYKNPDGGLYEFGYKTGIFAAVRNRGRREHLINKYSDLMREVTEAFDLTSILLENINGTALTIHKEQTESSVYMAAVGNTHPPAQIWSSMLAAGGTPIPGCPAEDVQFAKEKGWLAEFEKLRPNFCRLGFLLTGETAKAIDIIGFGGTPLQLNQENLPTIIAFIKEQLKGINQCQKNETPSGSSVTSNPHTC